MKTETDHMPHSTSTDRIQLPNALLLGEVEKILAGGRTVMLRATGNSMLPFIVGGRDSVLVRRPSEMQSLQVGQIALVHLPDSRYVLHRIVHIDGTEIVLMGDGNLRETESCRLSGIVGVVTKIIRNGHYVDSDARLECFMATVWRQLLPVRRYLLYLYKRLWL